jgi:integrase
MHTSAIGRIWKVAPHLSRLPIHKLTVADVTALIAALAAKEYKRETIKKTRDALAMTLDHFGIEPNPARDKRVKLPKERKAHIAPPLAEHVERVAETLPRHHVLPFLILDACGPRVNDLQTAQQGDLDEHRRGIRVRSEVEKNERYRLLELPDDLFEALLATLPPREDRDPEAPLFTGFDEAALRTSITRACKATGVPHFAPHGLRRRRGSLHYMRTGSLAEVAEKLGDSKRVACPSVSAASGSTSAERSGTRRAASSPATQCLRTSASRCVSNEPANRALLSRPPMRYSTRCRASPFDVLRD